MKNVLLFLFLFFNIGSGYAQNIEVVGGLNHNSFFDIRQSDPHYSSSYTSDYGYAVRLAIENVKIDWLNLRFTLSYDKYSGDFTASSGGLGGGYTTDASIDKSVFSLGVFPFNFRVINRIDLNFGFEFSGLINEKLIGTSSGWVMYEPDWSCDLNERYDRFSSKAYFGLRGRVAYDFNISEEWAISPQYSFYYGLSSEFDEFPETAKSMRHFWGIGLQKKFK